MNILPNTQISRTRKDTLSFMDMNTNKNTRPETAATDYRLVRKYQREAAKAGLTNPFIRKIQHADCNKTGVYLQFCKAVENHTPFHSLRFNFRGYDGSLWVEPHDNDDSYYRAGDLSAGFSKEFRNSLNGYYYLLINERTFIGYDVD